MDTIEALAWASSPDWGYNKHPPFSAFVVGVVYFIFGANDWAYYFLSQVFDLVDKIAVFRQGRIIDVVKTSEVTGNDVVALITGLDKKNREVGQYI